MNLLSLFRGKDQAKGLVSEIKELADDLFTSDEERKGFYLKIEQLQMLSNNVLARTGRAALMWSLSLVAVYNLIVRDLLGVFMGVDVPPATLEADKLIGQIVGLIAGTI